MDKQNLPSLCPLTGCQSQSQPRDLTIREVRISLGPRISAVNMFATVVLEDISWLAPGPQPALVSIPVLRVREIQLPILLGAQGWTANIAVGTDSKSCCGAGALPQVT